LFLGGADDRVARTRATPRPGESNLAGGVVLDRGVELYLVQYVLVGSSSMLCLGLGSKRPVRACPAGTSARARRDHDRVPNYPSIHPRYDSARGTGDELMCVRACVPACCCFSFLQLTLALLCVCRSPPIRPGGGARVVASRDAIINLPLRASTHAADCVRATHRRRRLMSNFATGLHCIIVEDLLPLPVIN
jgi:hypothetical protein